MFPLFSCDVYSLTWKENIPPTELKPRLEIESLPRDAWWSREFVSSCLPAGFVPYITTTRHFQEGVASPSHLDHVWACFLLCHWLPCAALHGPVSIPSILYLAHTQLESQMDISAWLTINSGQDNGKSPMSTPNQVKIPGWTFATSFQAYLAACTIGRWKEVATENGSELHYNGLCPVLWKLLGLGEKNGWARKLSCSLSSAALEPEGLPALRTLRTPVTERPKEGDLNQSFSPETTCRTSTHWVCTDLLRRAGISGQTGSGQELWLSLGGIFCYWLTIFNQDLFWSHHHPWLPFLWSQLMWGCPTV